MTRNVTTRPDPGDPQTTIVEVDGEQAGGFTPIGGDGRTFAAHFEVPGPTRSFYSDGIDYATPQAAIDAIVEQYGG